MLSDFRFAFRTLTKSPGFTAVAILTLGVGLAVNTIFTSIANDFLFRPLPAATPDELVVIAIRSPSIQYQYPYSYADAEDFRSFVEGKNGAVPDMARVFSGLIAYKEQIVHLSQTGKSTKRAWVHAVTDNYFSVLGVQPQLGRFFLPEEVSSPGSEAVLVLTHDTWSARYNADPSIIGQTLKINGVPLTVIGVAPKGFVGASWGTALSGFVPATMLTKLLPSGEHWALKRGNTAFFLMGRLHPGATVEQAQAATELAFTRIMQENPGKYLPNSRAAVMREDHSRPSPFIAQHVPKVVGALTALGLLVLTVALANATNLLYARNAGREREFAICSAIGATRFQLIRRQLAESLLLALAAGLFGGLAATWLSPALLATLPTPPNLAPAAETGVDWRPFAVTGVVSLLCGLLAGILPALRASNGSPLSLMRATALVSRRPLRRLLVVGQLAVSTIVLACAALALRSVILLSKADLGFRTENLFLASFDLGAQRYDTDKGRRFQTELLDQVRALPGTEAASLVTGSPLGIDIGMLGGIKAAGESTPGDQGLTVPTIRAEYAYLSTIGLPLLEGRDFTIRDDDKAPRVAIVNPSLARALWPNQNAIGQRISIQGRVAEVVGVVGPSRYYSIQEPGRPLLVIPLAQEYRGEVTLVVRSTMNTAHLTKAITAAVRKLDPDLPLFNPRTMQQQIVESPSGIMPYRMGAVLAGFQGSLALVLAGAGIFALITFSVAQRTREIGIRVALGATRMNVIHTVSRESLVLTGIGLGIGLVAAAGIAHAMADLLYGDGKTTFLVLVAVAAVVLLTTALACWLPVRRALRVNPVEALRAE